VTDVDFPVLTFASAASPQARGAAHGESFREAIGELVEIRTRLMCQKNPQLNRESIRQLAGLQHQATRAFDPELGEELEGIAAGASLPLHQIIVLNNYTDFRDIEVPDQGCSAIYVQRGDQRIAGQTWDMHRSAKHFVCCLQIPGQQQAPAQVVFSVVGCLGMMGFVSGGRMVGVNNLNTIGAVPGVIWPAVIRKLLAAGNRQQEREILRTAPLTSGRSFLLAGPEGGEFWEAMPGLQQQVSALTVDQAGALFHTNHCLGDIARTRENSKSLSSTTHARYQLLEKKIDSVIDLNSGWELLNDHEGYPLSICSNYQTSAQDPSVTCGGGIGDLNTGQVRLWRGDKLYDQNFIEHSFQM
jgi:isopenicillin-N N-acyltransferase-like protein